MSSGHIPNSISLPFSELTEPQSNARGQSYTTLKDPAALRKAIVDALGTDSPLTSRQIVNSCGSGMSAAMYVEKSPHCTLS